QIMSDTVKECTNVNLQYPRLVIASRGTLADGIVSRPSGPISIRISMKDRIKSLRHIPLYRSLSHPIGHCRDTKDTVLAVVLRNTLLKNWRWEVRSRT